MHLSSISLGCILVLSSAMKSAEGNFAAKNFLSVNKAEGGFWWRRGGKKKRHNKTLWAGKIRELSRQLR